MNVAKQSYEGYAIELKPGSSDLERQNILNLLRNSPLIFKVFENVIPDEVIVDPGNTKSETEEPERARNDNRPTKRKVIVSNLEKR
jgi:hypothetical protein